MIGFKILVAFLLPMAMTLVAAIPSNPYDAPIAGQRGKTAADMIEESFLDYDSMHNMTIIACNVSAALPILGHQFAHEFCAVNTLLAKAHNALRAHTHCSYVKCTYDANYDPSSRLCQCNWGTTEQMNEDRVWPNKNCKGNVTCYGVYEPHWNPLTKSCTCAIDTIHPFRWPLVRFQPKLVKDISFESFQFWRQYNRLLSDVNIIFEQHDKYLTRWATALKYASGSLDTLVRVVNAVGQIGVNVMDFFKRKVLRRNTSVVQLAPIATPAPDAVSLAPLPTYIPPPNTQVTQELIQESLLIQPQQLATVHSVIPQFADGVVTFFVQLDGPVSQTLALNATDTLPCENIGAQPQPSLILVPKTVKNRTFETTLPTCLVIAVNMYSPKFITYWVQKEDGSIFSLLSDSKIHAVDQLDTSQPASVAIRVASTGNNVKRAANSNSDTVSMHRRQIFSIDCDASCPFYHMDRIISNDGFCGCMFKGADRKLDIVTRGVEELSPYTVTMTAEACAAMTCINNGGRAALFNPFTGTCWCARPTFVEENDNAYHGGL